MRRQRRGQDETTERTTEGGDGKDDRMRQQDENLVGDGREEAKDNRTRQHRDNTDYKTKPHS